MLSTQQRASWEGGQMGCVCGLHRLRSLEQVRDDSIAHVNSVLVEQMHQTAHRTLVILTQAQLHASQIVGGVTEAERAAVVEATAPRPSLLLVVSPG